MLELLHYLTGYWTGDFLIDTLLFLVRAAGFIAVLAGAVFVIGGVFWWLSRLLPRRARDGVNRLFRHIYFDLFNGAWRLTLLSLAGVALSIGSLWTTWGGLSSFTKHPVLAFLIGLGIQTVMFMAAWLIGESFATGMVGRSTGGASRRTRDAWIGMVLGLLLTALAFWWLLDSFSFEESPWRLTDASTRRFVLLATLFAAALLACGIVYFFRATELLQPYVRALGVIVTSTVLWVMFMASLTASTFFSFDYHFNSIFNPKLREETARLRTQRQIPDVLNDLAGLMEKYRKDERERFFSGKPWGEYGLQLASARQVADRIPDLLHEQDRKDVDKQQTRMAELEATLTKLKAESEPLRVRRKNINAQVETLTASRPTAGEKVNKLTAEVNGKEDQLRRADAEVVKERAGVEGAELSGKRGAGTRWAKAKKKADDLRTELATLRPQLAAASGQLDEIDASLKRALEERGKLDRDLSEFDAKISVTEAAHEAEKKIAGSRGASADPGGAAKTLLDRIQSFRENPDAEGLKGIRSACNNLRAMGMRVADDEARLINCDPREFSEALTAFLNLRSRIDDFAAKCATKGLTGRTKTEDMLSFARGCLEESWLPNEQLTPLRTTVGNLTALQDDKAQSFNVTLTAFEERNRLAMLALVIAITVDILIFFAGVFAATTMTGTLEKAGLRDVARRVRRLPAAEVRAALRASRDHAFAESQLEDPQINRIVALGLDRPVPDDLGGGYLVSRETSGEEARYQLHQIYFDGLYDRVESAECRGDLEPVVEEPVTTASSPLKLEGERDRTVRLFTAPRPSANAA